jgi:DNA polymerase-3 subunit gamma/tau
MVLVRLCHVADLPAPEEAVRALSGETAAAAPPPRRDAPAPARTVGEARASARPRSAVARAMADAAPMHEEPPSGGERAHLSKPVPESFLDVVALAARMRDIRLKTALERSVRPVRFTRGHIEIALVEGESARIANDLAAKLNEWTGERWVVSLTRDEGPKTIHPKTIQEDARDRRAALLSKVRSDPVVEAVLETFPDARIVDVREDTPPDFDTGAARAHMDEDQDTE